MSYFALGDNENLFIDIVGSLGRSQKRRLVNPVSDDKTDIFRIKAVDLGDIDRIVLYKTGSHQCHIDKVVIDSAIDIVKFNCRTRRITEEGTLFHKTDEEDIPPPVEKENPEIDQENIPISETAVSKQSEASRSSKKLEVDKEELKSSTKSAGKSAFIPPKPVAKTPAKLVIKTKFKGIVVTSDILGAGTDANVEIWLTDSTGKTAGPIKITEQGDAMERNQRNPITIKLISDLIDLYKIALRHDGTKGKSTLKSQWNIIS